MAKEQKYFRTPEETEKSAKRFQKKTITREPLEEGGVYKFVGGKLVLVESAPRKAFEIERGQTYQSRDGRPVRIVEINPGSEAWAIIGLIKDEIDGWVPRVYDGNGISKNPYGPGNDLVAEWSET
jgi:hypothetical protein